MGLTYQTRNFSPDPTTRITVTTPAVQEAAVQDAPVEEVGLVVATVNPRPGEIRARERDTLNIPSLLRSTLNTRR